MDASFFICREKLLVALARLRAGRSAQGLILLCENQSRREQFADWIESERFGQCVHLASSIDSPDADSYEGLGPLLSGLHNLTRARGLQLLTETSSQLTDHPSLDRYQALCLEDDLLTSLVAALGTSAKSTDEVLLLTLWDLHRLRGPELALLLAAIHRSIQLRLPVMFCGTASTSFRRSIGDAAGYGERLFELCY